MPGTTPLLGIAYPVATDAPEGHLQMESIARSLEMYGLVVAADATTRDSLITDPLKHPGSMVYLTSEGIFQLWDGANWKDVWTAGDKPVRRVASLPGAGDVPGMICSRTSDDTIWFSTGGAWVLIASPEDVPVRRMNDLPGAAGNVGMIVERPINDSIWFSNGSKWIRVSTWEDPNYGGFEAEGSLCTTTSTNGTLNPTGGPPVKVDITIPESGMIEISVSAVCRSSGTTGNAVVFGYQVNMQSGSVVHAFNNMRAARHETSTNRSVTWVSMVTTLHAGETLRVNGVHASVPAGTGSYQQREIVARPVR